MSNFSPAALSIAPVTGSYLPPSDRVEFQQLIDLVSKCKGTGEKDPAFVRLLPFIKNFVRQSDAHAHLAVEVILAKLRDPLALVRLNIVHVVDCLFMRSKAFRGTLLDSFHAFLDFAAMCTVPSASSPLPPRPPSVAVELQRQTISCVKTWNETYGEALKLLRLGCEHMLSRVGNIHAPSRNELASAVDAARAVRRAKLQEILRARYTRMQGEVTDGMAELEECIKEIEGGLELLFPQVNQADFNQYLLRSDSVPFSAKSTEDKADDSDERPKKRVKFEESTSNGESAAAVNSHSTAAASSSVADAAVSSTDIPSGTSEEFEWESEAVPTNVLAATTAVAAASASAGVSNRNKPLPSLLTSFPPAALAPIPPIAPADPAAFVFVEKASDRDPLWWMDEEECDEDGNPLDDGSEMAEPEDEDMKTPTDEAEEQKQQTNHLTHGLGNRNYTLQIEFDANFASTETDDNRAIFQSLRDTWSRVEKSLLPMLNEWIDTLTRVEFPDASNGPQPIPNPSVLRAARDRLLLRCVAIREKLDLLLKKCARLNLNVSTLTADRLAAVRRATERTLIEAELPIPSSSSASTTSRVSRPTNAPVPSATEIEAADHTRHAAQILVSRANAEKRALKRIQKVKRKHAKLLEAERVERRNNPAAAAAHSAAASMRRPFSHANPLATAQFVPDRSTSNANAVEEL